MVCCPADEEFILHEEMDLLPIDVICVLVCLYAVAGTSIPRSGEIIGKKEIHWVKLNQWCTS